MAALMRKHVLNLAVSKKFGRNGACIHTSSSCNAKGLRRTVKNVFRSEEGEQVLESITKTRPTKWKVRLGDKIIPATEYGIDDDIQSVTTKYVKKENTDKHSTDTDSHPKNDDLNQCPYKYRKIGKTDRFFGSKILEAKTASQREKYLAGRLLLEGHKLINDADEAGICVRQVFFDSADKLHKLTLDPHSETEFYKVLPSRMKLFSDLKSKPGIFGIVDFPTVLFSQANRLPITVVLDGVREPGDMGTLLRTATVVGCHGAIVMKGCADAWQSAVLRAGAGAHFRLPILCGQQWKEIPNYIASNVHVCLVQEYDPNKHQDSKGFTDLHKEGGQLDNEESFVTETGKMVESSYLYRNTEPYTNIPVPRTSLFDLDIDTSKHVVVVISGAEGASGAAKKLLYDNGGEDVFIPSSDKKVTTLNTALTGCSVLMEIKRQFLRSNLQGTLSDDLELKYKNINNELKEMDEARPKWPEFKKQEAWS